MTGSGTGSELVVQWSDVDKFLAVVEDVASQEKATLRAGSGKGLPNFSLESSRSAAIDLEDCVKVRGVALAEEEVAVRNVMPVQGGTDPF